LSFRTAAPRTELAFLQRESFSPSAFHLGRRRPALSEAKASRRVGEAGWGAALPYPAASRYCCGNSSVCLCGSKIGACRIGRGWLPMPKVKSVFLEFVRPALNGESTSSSRLWRPIHLLPRGGAVGATSEERPDFFSPRRALSLRGDTANHWKPPRADTGRRKAPVAHGAVRAGIAAARNPVTTRTDANHWGAAPRGEDDRVPPVGCAEPQTVRIAAGRLHPCTGGADALTASRSLAAGLGSQCQSPNKLRLNDPPSRVQTTGRGGERFRAPPARADGHHPTYAGNAAASPPIKRDGRGREVAEADNE